MDLDRVGFNVCRKLKHPVNSLYHVLCRIIHIDIFKTGNHKPKSAIGPVYFCRLDRVPNFNGIFLFFPVELFQTGLARQQASKPGRELASKQASKQASIEASKQGREPASKQASTQGSKQASERASNQASKQASQPASQQASKQSMISGTSFMLKLLLAA